jgi:hypothetical protein
MPSEPILDTVVLRVMSFAHIHGIDIMLSALESSHARFPAEVYNRDEDDALLTDDALTLSELARGIRYARDRVTRASIPEQARYRAWLENAAQLHGHFQQGRLIVDSLTFDEVRKRDEVMNRHGIGRGEAACLVLAKRIDAIAAFVSSDRLACKAAQSLDIPYTTLEQILERWVVQRRPDLLRIEDLARGMRSAKYGLRENFLRRLISLSK